MNLILAVALACGPRAWAGHYAETVADPRSLVGEEVPAPAGAPAMPGFPERLVFDVKWGFIPVGQSTLDIKRRVSFAGRPAYEIESRAVGNPFCDTFYKVRDLNLSWIDASSFASLGYLKNLREGHFFRDEWVLFDYAAGRYLARTTSRDGSFSVRQGTIPAQVQDVLSSMYYVRTKELKVGADVVLDVNTKDNWPLVARVVKRQTVKVPAGKFEAFRLDLAMRKEGIFIQKGKRLSVWVTADERKIPVLMKVEVFFGHITASLASVVQDRGPQ